jgi:acyl-CoA thioester hydrolase
MKSKEEERPEFLNGMTESHLFRFPVTVYYEDTDITGVVYHANYLKYCERARSEILGAERLYQIHQQENLSFVVYQAEMNFRRGAVLGDRLEVQTQPNLTSPYRIQFLQNIMRSSDQQLLVKVVIELVCIRQEKPVPIPDWIKEHLPNFD